MTRISQPSQAETAHLDRSHEAGRSGNESEIARHAALYRSTTRFAYAAKPQGNQRGSLRTRKLAQLQAKRRRAAALRRSRMSGSGGVDDDGDDEGGAHEESRRVTRDGGGGGGGGGDHGGQSHDGQHDGEGAVPPAIRMRPGEPAPPLEPGALQTLAATCSNDAEKTAAVRGGLCDGLLDVRDGMAAHPDAAFDARLYELSADARAALRHGTPKSVNPAELRELMIASSRRRGGSENAARGTAGTPPSSAHASNADAGTAQPQLSRVQRLNLLGYLFLLNAQSPLPPSQRDRSINTLSSLRAGALARGKRPR
ncbi:hypothetical protein [Paraburkholderia ginsengiterrae]|uniref:Uncharacterized protein n=1 Tax=Paraburkholderia ginsengiterrae TaxID=1462993 RepID=A0A1A9NB80_9BURK|nr:hypothetical protein [Paraburkholderia ginsengiterrae]OAJ62869.1 hypothetical protein A6V37_21900 [Paraburkholderia ginsengiterrae]